MSDEVTASRDIAAPPEAVFAMVTDLPRMGEWSPENTGGHWKGGATSAAVGARFSGSNRNGWHRWTTTATVRELVPERTFSFDVTSMGLSVANWRYDIEPTDTGCRVTESWTDMRPGWFASVARLATGVADRAAYTQTSMETTLEALGTAAAGS